MVPSVYAANAHWSRLAAWLFRGSASITAHHLPHPPASSRLDHIVHSFLLFLLRQVGSQHMMPTGKLTVFHGLRPPPIGLQAYVERVAKFTKCSPVCFVMALVYMDLLAQVRDTRGRLGRGRTA